MDNRLPVKPSYEELQRRIRDLEEDRIAFERSGSDLARLFTMLLDPVCVADLQTSCFIRVNRAFTTTLGYSATELVGKPVFDFIHPDDRQSTLSSFEEKLRSGLEVTHFENRCRCKDGEYRWLSWMWRPNLEEGIAYAVARDITQRRRTATALKESESRYRSLFHESHAVMLLIDPEGGKIMDANPAALSYYGYRYEEITGKKIYDINMLTQAQINKEMDRARREVRNEFHFRHRLANGDIRCVEVYSGPIVIHGRQLLYSIIHDVTVRTQVEAEKEKLIGELRKALREIKTLRGILPICSSCKVIRDDQGYWKRLEAYIHEHSEAQFSHGLCPDCMRKLYPEYVDRGGRKPDAPAKRDNE